MEKTIRVKHQEQIVSHEYGIWFVEHPAYGKWPYAGGRESKAYISVRRSKKCPIGIHKRITPEAKARLNGNDTYEWHWFVNNSLRALWRQGRRDLLEEVPPCMIASMRDAFFHLLETCCTVPSHVNCDWDGMALEYPAATGFQRDT